MFAQLADRMGRLRLQGRLEAQVGHASKIYGGQGLSRFHPENSQMFNNLVSAVLSGAGLMERARRNAMDYRIVRLQASFPDLPASFDGFTLLHLTDIHADAIPDGGGHLADVLAGLSFDQCVVTGDFRFLTWGEYSLALERTATLLAAVKRSRRPIGVLGNHDFIEMVPGLEALGLRVLLNESARVNLGGETLWFLGVDDPHFYGTHDLDRADLAVPRSAFRILLCHSPELFDQAADLGVQLYLCGHTHGGQICLPGRIPILTNAACPRTLGSGPWKRGDMLGYTSRGTGTSGCAARFFCPPEVTLFTLRRDPQGPGLRLLE